MSVEKIVLLLQNRYRKEGVRWENCYSHGMLRPVIEAMGGEGSYLRMQADSEWYDCPTPDYEIDEDIADRVRAEEPDYIVACGVAAKKAIRELVDEYSVFTMPHPAWRNFSKEMQNACAEAVAVRYEGDMKEWINCGGE